MIKKLLKEALAFKAQIDEVDWENTFSDVKKSCISPDELTKYLNDVRQNAFVDYGDRTKFDKKNPYIHSKSTFFKKGEEVDVDYFIKQITHKPTSIINTNDKILKSGSNYEYVYKTGIPAFRGIVYDMKQNKFFNINTCPGAGSCVMICYAMKGRYIQYPAAYDSLTRRLNYLLNSPDKYKAQMLKELKEKCELHKAFIGFKSKVILRWNDSGDFFSKKYVQIAEEVIDELTKSGYNIESYAYTKVGDVVNNSKLDDLTFSSGSNKKEAGKVNTTGKKTSEVVPSELFKDLDLMRISDEAELKKRIAKHFNLDIKDVITYDELMRTPVFGVPRWNVIVTPNDGDDAAFNKDVKSILLKQH